MARRERQEGELARMEAARRKTQHQLDLIDRQIMRRMTALIPQLGRRQGRLPPRQAAGTGCLPRTLPREPGSSDGRAPA
ncbi:hypothetical protein REMIM1_PE00097 (plasmid) [Rhizobium etli bv. mimosae str. Mim1]|nr:hypothetical protein REMIM1_PE00097 [Rhizobium etli bv. mimosae str. Mim1]